MLVVQARLPDVVDGAEQILGGEELHPVAREPGDHVVRVLQVGGDVLLEGVVVDLVELDRDVLVRERLDRGVQTLPWARSSE